MYLNDSKLQAMAGSDSLIVIPDEFKDLITTSDVDRFQPASVELHLHPVLLIQQKAGDFKEHDLRKKQLTLKNGDFVIASTVEVVNIPADHLARVEGKSSNARVGLLVHCTGGFIDPGFTGQITLEIALVGKAPVTLEAFKKVAQLAVAECYLARFPYGHERRASKYLDQLGATVAR
jgi:dCTP deaminase